MTKKKEEKPNKNMELWDAVCKTDPKYTKKANVRGNNLTSIAPQYRIKCATERFGSYGKAWGFSNIAFDYSLVELTGLIGFVATFYYPDGEFPISSSISAYRDNARTKPDQDYAKKVETDTLTKALSKIGFAADVFMGSFDDDKYISQMNEEFKEPPAKPKGSHKLDTNMRPALSAILASTSLEELEQVKIDFKDPILAIYKEWPAYMSEISGEQTKSFTDQIDDHKERLQSQEDIEKQQREDSGFKKDFEFNEDFK